ncbi:13376_t:CDS:2 [Funneliformis geosporum]|nr:13376_t:CDS:2 [Funneliformis geosporum]
MESLVVNFRSSVGMVLTMVSEDVSTSISLCETKVEEMFKGDEVILEGSLGSVVVFCFFRVETVSSFSKI